MENCPNRSTAFISVHSRSPTFAIVHWRIFDAYSTNATRIG